MEKYQISKFVKKIKYSDDEVILYNTMNSAIVVMPKEQMNNINEMNTDELTELEQMGFFASEENAIEFINDKLMSFNPDYFTIIIEMTKQCNFRCKYCYQNDWNRDLSISYEVIDRCVQYIESCLQKFDFKKVGVSFFGGEPLLVKEKIYYAYDKIKQLCDKYSIKLVTEVTSNGYLLDCDFLEHFEQINYLTTLSLKSDHDKKRKHITNKGTYDSILSNILACKHLFQSDKYMLGIRYNVDDTNITDFEKFLEGIKTLGIPAKVTTSYTYEHSMNNYYNLLSYNEYKVWNSTKAIETLIKYGYKVSQVPGISVLACEGYSPYSIKVFSDGQLGLCNASVDKSMIRGSINDICCDVDNVKKIFPEKVSNPINGSSCKKCSDIFLCGGVKFCRQHSMCEYNEIDIEQFLKTYVEVVKMGYGDLIWNK